jgi:heptosyltransferase-2
MIQHAQTPHKIVVRAPNWIGDQILAYPCFHYLRQGYPDAHITAVCPPWVAAIQFRHLVDEVCILPQPTGSSVWARLRALEAGARLLRTQGPWDLGLCLPNAFSSAWLLARAGVRWRRGYATDGRGWLLHDPLVWKTQASQHRAETYVQVLPDAIRPQDAVQKFWGESGRDASTPRTPDVCDRFDARRAWPVADLVEPPASPYWVLAPGSMAMSRRWPREKFAELARQIARATGMCGLVVGGAAETTVAQLLCADAELKLADWTARGVVAAYWQVFRQARFTVSNDSGLAHVAALCGSPVYIAWGAGDPHKTRPLGPGRVSIVRYPVDCWPCERNVCLQPKERTIACLQGLRPEAVWQEIQRF